MADNSNSFDNKEAFGIYDPDAIKEKKKKKYWWKTLLIVVICAIVIVFVALLLTVLFVPEFNSLGDLVNYIKAQY